MIHTDLTADVPSKENSDLTVDEIALIKQIRQEQNKGFAQIMMWIVYNGATLAGVEVNNPRKFPKL